MEISDTARKLAEKAHAQWNPLCTSRDILLRQVVQGETNGNIHLAAKLLPEVSEAFAEVCQKAVLDSIASRKPQRESVQKQNPLPLPNHIIQHADKRARSGWMEKFEAQHDD